MKAVAAMMVIAMFASVCAVAASVLSLVLKRQKKMLLFITGGAAIAAGNYSDLHQGCPGFLKGGGPISLGSLIKRSSDFKRGDPMV